MSDVRHRVAIVGCGNLGQIYADAYSTYPDTEIVAIAEHNTERRKAVGEKYGVKALYQDIDALLRDMVPDVVAVITPTKYFKEAVTACAEAGVKGVSTDKPIAATLSDADEMVEVCESRGVVYAGGNLLRAMNELQEVAGWLRAGEYGELIGASIIGWGAEISGGGCQDISVLRLLADAEIEEVVAWGTHRDAPYWSEDVVARNSDDGLITNARFRLTNGLECTVFGTPAPLHDAGRPPHRGTDVWSQDSMVRTRWGNPPEIYQGFDAGGERVRVERPYTAYRWSQFRYLTGSIRSFLASLETGSKLWISGHDLRQALEVAIAARLSVQLGSVPVKLPLEDRSHTLYPRPNRWLGRDETVPGRRDQTIFREERRKAIRTPSG